MLRLMAVLCCVCGVLVVPEVLPPGGISGGAHLHADVGDLTDEEYASLMLYLSPQDTYEQDVADAVNMLLTPPEPEFDHEGFMEVYWQLMNEAYPIPE